MSILTEKERELIVAPEHMIDAIEDAILAKLAGMELPEPAINTFVQGPMFTAAQLHQAYAQGAASQLSAEPVGYTNKSWIDSSNKPALSEEFNVPVYTLKEAK